MSAPILELENISVAYGKVEAVRGVSLTMQPGSIVTVIGANGAGKTTLLNALMGILPADGAVKFNGTALDGDAIEERVAMGMALVPERRELFGSMTVEDNLLLGGFRTTATERAQSLAHPPSPQKGLAQCLFRLETRLRPAAAAGTAGGK